MNKLYIQSVLEYSVLPTIPILLRVDFQLLKAMLHSFFWNTSGVVSFCLPSSKNSNQLPFNADLILGNRNKNRIVLNLVSMVDVPSYIWRNFLSESDLYADALLRCVIEMFRLQLIRRCAALVSLLLPTWMVDSAGHQLKGRLPRRQYVPKVHILVQSLC